MRTEPPHPLISYRNGLVAIALLCWGVAALVLIYFKQDPAFPTATVVGLSALGFIWTNGFYWWIVFKYPYIEASGGQFVSRDERKEQDHGPFLVGYLVCALLGSAACLNVALS